MNTKTILLLGLFIGLLYACNSNTMIKKPDNLIEKELMIQVITDTYLAKAAFSEKNLQGKKHINYHPFVYQKYQIDSISFYQSLNYYASRIDENEEIFKTVEQNLNTQLEKLKSLENKKK